VPGMDVEIGGVSPDLEPNRPHERVGLTLPRLPITYCVVPSPRERPWQS
jgi:hypothetical protein